VNDISVILLHESFGCYQMEQPEISLYFTKTNRHSWQRDLTDSSAQRNIGVAFGHSVLAISNVIKGLQRLDIAADVIAADLESNWEVLAEAIQMVMRAEAIAGTPGMENPYERLKELTRGHRVDAVRLKEFVGTLGLSAEAQERLSNLTPHTYNGIAAQLVDHAKDAQG